MALRAQSVKRTRAERAENTQIIQSQAELDLECLRARSQALRTREKRSLEKREIHKGKSEQYVGDVWKQRLEMEEKERVLVCAKAKSVGMIDNIVGHLHAKNEGIRGGRSASDSRSPNVAGNAASSFGYA